MKKFICCLTLGTAIAFGTQIVAAQSLEDQVAAAISTNHPQLLASAETTVKPTAVEPDEAALPQEHEKKVKKKKVKLTSFEKQAKEMAKLLKKQHLNSSQRYILIATDTKFAYYLDRESSRWIKEPDTDQKIIDVWLRLVDINDVKNHVLGSYMQDAPQGEYLLDHYYIRPYDRQVQFLCELNVVGQPANDIMQNPYSAGNWEYAIPGSVEDHIYNSVMAIRHELPNAIDQAEPITQTAADFIERTLNISL